MLKGARWTADTRGLNSEPYRRQPKVYPAPNQTALIPCALTLSKAALRLLVRLLVVFNVGMMVSTRSMMSVWARGEILWSSPVTVTTPDSSSDSSSSS